jgi:hypothetical protein
MQDHSDPKAPTNEIERLANNHTYSCSRTVLYEPGSVSFSRGQIAWILANSYLGRLPNPGYLTWHRLLQSGTFEARERLRCLYNYFERVGSCVDLDEVVVFELLGGATYTVEPDQHLLQLPFFIKLGQMEDAVGAIVDFANKNIHIHAIIPSLTQEEILFSTCSECFIALLCCPNTVKDDEVIVIKNVWRHATYTGYAETFMFTGSTSAFTDVLCVDAPMSGQFDCIDRDIAKAVLAFSATESTTVTSGKWGCGAFGGDFVLKFLEQLIASQLAHKLLHFTTFGNEEEKKALETIDLWVSQCRPTIARTIDAMKKYKGKGFFYKFMVEQFELMDLSK